MHDDANEYKACLVRAFAGYSDNVHIRMDGETTRSSFLRACWNYAVDQGWLRTEDVYLEQETFFKGYLTDKGREALGMTTA